MKTTPTLTYSIQNVSVEQFRTKYGGCVKVWF
jgi:hypothetical protein